ncbi:Oidioi.mRNA.OKI2018_I69.PAR.g11305.t1.cds [Oikopleura dioica]|uniref:Oidioi.mRNA.OKI2018_I69.PAR.g11305.t1.cds n=1 Tax=Oikopleura dioica TaxID=34765 RepID=A0ABN7RZ81_OIKDI|nr:Oidioi.mRNA.OKI2018_I69.PAR.g11305.t1.cds [Oikopleura dioica]
MTFFNLPLSADIAVFSSIVFACLFLLISGILLAAYCLHKHRARRERVTRPIPQIFSVSGAPSMMSAISTSTPKTKRNRNNSCFVHCPSPNNTPTKPASAFGTINPAFQDDFVSVIVDF